MRRSSRWLSVLLAVAWYGGLWGHYCGFVPGPWWAWTGPFWLSIAWVCGWRLRAWFLSRRKLRQARRHWTVICHAAEGEVRPGVGKLYINGQVQNTDRNGILDLSRFGQRPPRHRKGTR